MKKLSFKVGFLSLLVGLAVASCTKDANEGPMATPSEVTTQSEVIAPPTESKVDTPSAVTAEPGVTGPSTVMATTTANLALPTAPIGYAMVNGKTTGGAGGTTVTVSTLSALKTALGSSSPMIIKLSGTIKSTGSLTVKSNKSIIGLSGAALDGVGLKMSGVSNVIVQNINIKNIASSDAVQIYSAHHIWIDHCTFTNITYDGAVDITQGSDFVTVSWSKFTGVYKTSLVGADDATTSDYGKLNVTYHHNWFYNCLQRQPMIRYGRAHVFNNYYSSTDGKTGYGIGSCTKAIVRLDNNYFDNIARKVLYTFAPTAGIYGYFSGIKTNIFNKCGSNIINTAESTWVPTAYEYKSGLEPAANVPASVKAGAGAR